jgi:hypothetical protein
MKIKSNHFKFCSRLTFYSMVLFISIMIIAADRQRIAEIKSPVSGEVLQGVVSIQGNSDVINFQSYEIDFSYVDNPTDTWFFISEGKTPVRDGLLGLWDTTTITDGNYILRLRVWLKNGTQVVSTVQGLRIRNYSIIETSTPDISAVMKINLTPEKTDTPVLPTPTPLPRNPIEVSNAMIGRSVIVGFIIAAVFFISTGLYSMVRRLSRR